MMRFLTRLKLRSERAMALPLTVLVMASTGAITVSVVQYSTSSGRTANIGKSRVTAQTLAEAGIANAFSVLNNAVDPKTTSTLPPQASAVSVPMGTGTSKFWGSYNGATYTWTITGFGTVPNPTGGAALTKTLTRKALVHGLNDGASVGAWNRMFHASTTTCLRIEDVTIPTSITSAGDICLVGSGKITGAATIVEVGDDVTMSSTQTDSARAPVTGSGWTSSGNIVTSDNGYASTVTAISRNGTLVNGANFTTGQTLQGLNLDGTNDYVSLPRGIVAGLTDFTISTWVRLDTTAASRRIFDFGTGTSDYMYLTPTTGSAIRFGITTGGSGSEQTITGTTGLATGSWVHVTVTHIGNTGRMYVNGAQVGSSNTSMTVDPADLGTTTQNWIGRSQSSSNYLDGRLDDFRIYDRGLTSGEVTSLQTNQTTPTGLLARYVFENNANDSGPAPVSPSAALLATGFGFTIPTGSRIDGIEAWVERDASASGEVSDNEVHLLKAGAQVGSNFASGTMYGTSDQNQYYGGSGNLWGMTWTAEEINAGNFGLRFRVDSNTAQSIAASVDYITIQVTYLPPPTTSIGVPGTNILQSHVVDKCTFHTQAASSACNNADKVYATTNDKVAAGLSKPQIDMDFWYTNAKPGPKQACTTVVGTPPTWDNNSTYDLSLPVSDLYSEVTPTSRSYTCQVRDAQNNLLGELSWNHTTHVLTIFGTIFLDGDFRFDDNGQIVHYQGRGIIYAARDIEFDELVCAGGSGTTSATSCVTLGMQNWDPSVNMMTVLAGDDSEFDQGSTSDQPTSTPSGLQGIIYAVDDCLVHENFHLSGPIICDKIDLPDEPAGWPTYYAWPPLGSLVEGQSYGDPNDAADYVVTAGEQLG